MGQEQFIDINIEGDINDSEEGKKNFQIYQRILKSNEESYGIYIKNSKHYSYTDLKLIYRDTPLALPFNKLGKVEKSIVDEIMDNSILDFFNYSLKNQPFNFTAFDMYSDQVIYHKYP